MEWCRLTWITSLNCMCLSRASGKDLFHDLPGQRGKMTGQALPGSFLLAFYTMFPPFQSPETSSECHDFTSIMKSDLATTLISFLMNMGCISSGPIELCMIMFLRGSQTWSGKHFAPVVPVVRSIPSRSAKREVAGEDWGKRLPLIHYYGFSSLFVRMGIPPLTFPFWLTFYISVETFVILCVPCEGELHFDLGLLHPISTQLRSIKMLFPGGRPVPTSLPLHVLPAL